MTRHITRSELAIAKTNGIEIAYETFGDPVNYAAILDQILHHCTVISIKGNSYGLGEKGKAGLLELLQTYQQN